MQLNEDLSKINKNNDQLRALQASFNSNTAKLEVIAVDVQKATDMTVERADEAKAVIDLISDISLK